MPLTKECASLVGEIFQVIPINGWGWVKRGDLGFKHWPYSNLPAPFNVRYREPFFSERDLYGGIADVLEIDSSYAGLFFAFFSFTDGYSDFDSKTNSFQIKFFKSFPTIIPQLGKPTHDWVINGEDVTHGGYAKIKPIYQTAGSPK